MSPKELIQSDRSKFVVSLIWALVATIVLFVKEVTVPRMSDGQTQAQAISKHDLRIDKIERSLEKLIDGDRTGVLIQGQDQLAKAVERIETKLDDHILRESKQR
jgi:hypothetical protein